MKKLLIYSNDLIFSYSLLNYLQYKFDVIITSSLIEFREIVNLLQIDVIIMEIEPSEKIEKLCKEIHELKNDIPIVLIYVFNDRIKSFDARIRKFVESIFYQPIDVSEITDNLEKIMLKKV